MQTRSQKRALQKEKEAPEVLDEPPIATNRRARSRKQLLLMGQKVSSPFILKFSLLTIPVPLNEGNRDTRSCNTCEAQIKGNCWHFFVTQHFIYLQSAAVDSKVAEKPRTKEPIEVSHGYLRDHLVLHSRL